MMYKNGRYSPSSVTQDLSEKGSPSRSYPDVSKGFSSSRSTDSQEAFTSIAFQEGGKNYGSIPGKCRLLPCRTFISTGSCCYGDRCVFLHDQGVVSKPVYVKYLKKSKDDTAPDAFFWPMMPTQLVKNKLDNRNQPDINQAYLIPAPYVHPTNPNLSSNMNHFAVYSMWEHFVDFLAVDELSIVLHPRSVYMPNPLQTLNQYTGRKRLPCFQELSVGQQLGYLEEVTTVDTTEDALDASMAVLKTILADE